MVSASCVTLTWRFSLWPDGGSTQVFNALPPLSRLCCFLWRKTADNIDNVSVSAWPLRLQIHSTPSAETWRRTFLWLWHSPGRENLQNAHIALKEMKCSQQLSFSTCLCIWETRVHALVWATAHKTVQRSRNCIAVGPTAPQHLKGMYHQWSD